MSHASIYRTLNRLPHSDVHHVAEHIVGPESGAQQGIPISPKQDWTGRRRAKPAENLLPTTVRWLARLPFEFRPMRVGEAFPRIANALAALWTLPNALTSYLDDLLVDKRGGRRGFPLHVLEELHALRAYYATLHPVHSDAA